MNCSKHNKAAHYACLLLLFCNTVSATTVIVLVTDDGVFVAADSKITTTDVQGVPVNEAARMPPIQKVFNLHDRFLVAILGLDEFNFATHIINSASHPPMPSVITYDSPVTVAAIDKKLTLESSLNDLIDAIEAESIKTTMIYTFFSKIPEERQSNPVSVWVVATYQNGIPIIDAISWNIDWKNHIPWPAIINPWHPDPSFGVRQGFYAGGIVTAVREVEAARQIGDRNNDGYRYCVSHAFLECSHFTLNQHLPLDEAVVLLHTLLRLQAGRTPNEVGPPYRIRLLRPTSGIGSFDFPD